MAVFIDIPGIGNIEAKNAASEATLRDILRAVQSSGRGGSGTAGAGTAGAGGGALNPMNLMGKTAGGAARALGKMAGALGMATGAVVALGEGAVKVVEKLANVGDSVENAANVFSGLPLIGTLFSAVASASQKVNDSYLAAASGGATFAGSMNQFAASASAAGMTMENFAALIRDNGESMRLLGGTTEEGAKRFSQISKSLRTSSTELYNLGFSTADVNQGLANYSKYLGQTGKLGTKSNADLVAGAKNYLKEMDLLAKVTGESRKDQENARQKLLNDAQYQAKVANMSAEAGEAFANTVNGLPPGLRDVAKDIMVTGTATTEESQKFMALMPRSAQMMQDYARITENGGTITQEMQNRLNNMLAEEGKSAKNQYRTIGQYSKEMAGVYMNTVQASNIQTDAIKKAAADQGKAAKNADGMNEQMQKAQQALASISNEFTMYLANSGILQVMLDAFKMVVDFVRSYIVPAFNLLTTGVQSLWQLLTGSFGPALLVMKQFLIEVGSTIFEFGKFVWDATAPIRELAVVLYQRLMPAFIKAYDLVSDGFRAVSDIAQDVLRPAFDFLGRIANSVTKVLKDDFEGTLDRVSTWMDTHFIQPFVKVANYVNEKVVPIFEPVVRVFTEIKDKFVRVLASFNSFSDITESLKLRFQSMQISLQKLVLWVDETTDLWKTDDEKKEYERRRQEIADLEKGNAEARAQLDARLNKQADENLKKQQEEQARIDKEREARDAKITYERGQRDKKVAELQANNAKASGKATAGLSDAAKNLAETTSPKSTNYEDSIALAGIEYARNNPGAAPSAEAARAAVSNQPAQSAGTSQPGTGGGSGAPAGSTPAPRPQESTESLLANLNSKMDQLIQINRQVYSVNERQLTVQQSMTGDLFIAT